jgi:hypothetical protein
MQPFGRLKLTNVARMRANPTAALQPASRPPRVRLQQPLPEVGLGIGSDIEITLAELERHHSRGRLNHFRIRETLTS